MNEEDHVEGAEHEPMRDLELEHSKLKGDIELVRNYGEAHPDAWVDLWIENEPSVRIVVVFVGNDVDDHEATLRSLVAHPDQLEIHRSDRYSRAYLEGIEVKVRQMATTAERGSFRSWGIGRGRLNVNVQAARKELAQLLLESYGDAVKLRVGFLSYPDPMMNDTDMPRRSAPVPERPPLLPAQEIWVSVDDGLEVRSGEHLQSVLHIHNDGPSEIVVLTNGAVTARVVDPQTEVVVGGYEFAQTMPGIQYGVAPRGSAEVPLLVGTASTNPLLGYCVPPGRRAIEVSLNLEDRGVFRTPLLPIEVVD